MRSCAEHEFKTYVEQDDAFYNYPIHEDDIKKMPDYDDISNQRKNAREQRVLKIYRIIG